MLNREKLLNKLAQHIAKLAEQIALSDDPPLTQARFSTELFTVRGGAKLAHYLQEIQQNFARLSHESKHQHADSTAFLADRIVNQIEALQREIATLALRKAEQSLQPPERDLYQQLAQHQQYEQRLQVMIRDRENLLGQHLSTSRQLHLQREVAALHNRLLRCRQALRKLERQIDRNEIIG